MPPYDKIWKAVIRELFDNFLTFFFPQLYEHIEVIKGFKFLDKELRLPGGRRKSGSHYPDMLVQVWLRNGEKPCVLIHIEVQGYHDKNFTKRMFIYFYHLFDLGYEKIAAISIFTDARQEYKPDKYEYKFDETILMYKFRTYKIVEQNEAKLMRKEN